MSNGPSPRHVERAARWDASRSRTTNRTGPPCPLRPAPGSVATFETAKHATICHVPVSDRFFRVPSGWRGVPPRGAGAAGLSLTADGSSGGSPAGWFSPIHGAVTDPAQAGLSRPLGYPPSSSLTPERMRGKRAADAVQLRPFSAKAWMNGNGSHRGRAVSETGFFFCQRANPAVQVTPAAHPYRRSRSGVPSRTQKRPGTGLCGESRNLGRANGGHCDSVPGSPGLESDRVQPDVCGYRFPGCGAFLFSRNLPDVPAGFSSGGPRRSENWHGPRTRPTLRPWQAI